MNSLGGGGELLYRVINIKTGQTKALIDLSHSKLISNPTFNFDFRKFRNFGRKMLESISPTSYEYLFSKDISAL